VFVRSLYLVGGIDHARAVLPDVRRYWHSEGFDRYLFNLEAEKAAKG
jgi:hypothetical protein